MSVVWVGVENDEFLLYVVKFYKIFGLELTPQVLTPPTFMSVQNLVQVMIEPL